ncbi:MAG TPA: DUF4062 domain-containing protein [Saprospiraceae bacterium]|nr:DUF4062 domain-containing protein [Saprospiraceae bacterium]
MSFSNSTILTPDQRLRVFVSSTLQELAEERQAVKQAIQNIHLTPVMFEMGARPHAPRDLYRQYLAQSHIFIGIYWERYGWIAPEETISGLEDEYNLSTGLPKLIYIKNSDGQRDPKLSNLLDRIQSDDQVSYKHFGNSEELAGLILNDLALLLTERFNLASQERTDSSERGAIYSIPDIPGVLFGRDKNIEEISTVLDRPGVRLLTLTGPVGIWKTRLAMEAAKRRQQQYPDGAAFVPLAPIRDSSLVSETIAYHLGIKVTGGNNLDSLKLYFQDKKFLLVLDNFEQVIDAATIIDDLLYAAPGLTLLITSRERLSLSFEQVYVVPALPDQCDESHWPDGPFPAAIQLFIERAKAVQPEFEFNEQNREIICKICQRLEGLPLAIELAAGQIQLFSPALLLQKLDHRLEVLKGNFRDIPDRQKTIRKAIEWSFDLLSPEEQKMMLKISLYHAGCPLDVMEQMEMEQETDLYTLLSALVNKSLLFKQEGETQIRFQMLESVREFAWERMKQLGVFEANLEEQADYYHKALKEIKLQRTETDTAVILKHLEQEHANIRQSMDYLIRKNDVKRLTDMAWNLWLFWWINAHTKEGYNWLKKGWELYQAKQVRLDDRSLAVLAANVGFMSFLQRDFNLFSQTIGAHLELILEQEDDELVATTALVAGVVKTIQKDHETADQILKLGLVRYRKIAPHSGISMVLSALGRNASYSGNRMEEARSYYLESLKQAQSDKDEISSILALTGFALCEVLDHQMDAKTYLMQSIQLSRKLHFYEAIAWTMEIWALASINEGRMIHAITLMGAVDHLRNSTQLPVWDDLQAIIHHAGEQVAAQMDPDIFKQVWNEGAAMNLEEMVEYAMRDLSENTQPKIRKESVVPEAVLA